MANIIVLGDVALDIWLWGRPTCIAPEAGWALTYQMDDGGVEYSLGMAANAARVLTANGHDVFLCAELGADHHGSIVADLLAAAGIKHRGYMRAGATTLKIRAGVRMPGAPPYMLGRWDRDARLPHTSQNYPALDWTGVSGVLIAGYKKGGLARLGHLLEGCPPSAVVVADIKDVPLAPALPVGVDYACPNRSEYTERNPTTWAEHQLFLGPQQQPLRRGLVVTLGADGASYWDFPRELGPVNVHTAAASGLFPCGCGDVFAARLLDAAMNGFDTDTAARLAVSAASHAAQTGCFVWS